MLIAGVGARHGRAGAAGLGRAARLHGLPMFGAPTVAQLEDPSYRPGILGMKKVDESP